ncbi:MAG: hypothetical protein ACSLE1_07375 [Sphingobium sp.]
MFRVCLAVIALLFALPPAIAAPSDAGAKKLSKADRSMLSMDQYADCLLQYDRKKVIALAQMYPESRDYTRAAAKVAIDVCLEAGSISFDSQLLRGALFGALYRADFGAVAPSLRPVEVSYASDVSGINKEADAQYIALRQFAACVVHKDAENGRALILHPAGSKPEKEAFRALSPLFGPCLQSGIKVTFSKQMVVGLIAEAMYRESTG